MRRVIKSFNALPPSSLSLNLVLFTIKFTHKKKRPITRSPSSRKALLKQTRKLYFWERCQKTKKLETKRNFKNLFALTRLFYGRRQVNLSSPIQFAQAQSSLVARRQPRSLRLSTLTSTFSIVPSSTSGLSATATACG